MNISAQFALLSALVLLIISPTAHATLMNEAACRHFNDLDTVEKLAQKSEIRHSDSLTASMEDDVTPEQKAEILNAFGKSEFAKVFSELDNDQLDYVEYYAADLPVKVLHLYFYQKKGQDLGVILDAESGAILSSIQNDIIVDCRN